MAYKFGNTSTGGFQFTAPAKPSGNHGLTGLVENFANDVRDSAVGLPTGLVKTAEHPVSSVEAMAKSTWQDWSPLIEGNPDKFAHQFYAHPLAPLLDVASVFTGGAGIAGRVAKMGVDSGLVDEASKLGKLGDFASPGKINFDRLDKNGNKLPTLVKYTSSNPMSKAAQLMVHKAVNAASAHLPEWAGAPLSMDARYNRLETKMMTPRSAALQMQILTFVRAGKDLTGRDSRMYRRAVLRNSYKQLKRMGTEWDPKAPLPDGYSYVTGVPMVKAAGGRNGFFALKTDSIEKDLAPESFGKRYTTTDVRKAASSGNGSGHVIIVPKHTMNKFLGEGVSSSKAVKLLYQKPTTAWKMALLGYNPGFFTHNAVGNFFMYAMQHGGTAGVKGFADALAQVKGQGAALRSLGEAARDKALNPHWMEENFRDQLNNTFSSAVAQSSAKKGLQSTLYKYSMFPITHAVADQFLRRSAINAELRQAPEVQALMKQGMSFDDAAAKALKGGNGAARQAAADLRQRVSQKVMDTMGDYHSMNAGERQLAKLMPFYTWNRHALRFTKAALRDHPGRLNIASKMSNEGVEETQKELGDLPEFLLGSIPGSMLGIKSAPGRKSLLETASVNPLATVPDVLDAAQALTGAGKTKEGVGEALGGEMNPLLTGLIQYITGTNPETGAAVKRPKGGLAGSVAANTFGNLPQATLLERLIGGNPQPKANKETGTVTPFLFSKNKQAVVSQLLGEAIKQMSPAAAQKEYDEENNIKKGRKPKYSFGTT